MTLRRVVVKKHDIAMHWIEDWNIVLKLMTSSREFFNLDTLSLGLILLVFLRSLIFGFPFLRLLFV